MADTLKPLLESTDVHGLFPSPVWEFQLRDQVRDAINASGSERVSVSFNLMFPRYAEELGRPLWGEQ